MPSLSPRPVTMQGTLVYDAFCENKQWDNSVTSLSANLHLPQNFSIGDMQQCYATCWLKALHKPEPNKLCSLALAKSSFTAEPYVFNLPLYARRDFSRLRTSCHTLEIEVGRYAKPKVPRDLRACKLCKTDQVEDERHFLLGCSFFKDARKSFGSDLPENLVPFTLEDSPEIFKQIFSCFDGHAYKSVCQLARTLSAIRFEYASSCPLIFNKPSTIITKFAGGGGRVVRPPDRLTYY